MITEKEKDDIEKKISLLKNPMQSDSDNILHNSLQFEYKITYIAAGAIVSILVFANKHHIGTEYLLTGLILLLGALIMNLYSYIWYKNKLNKELDYFIDIRNGLLYKQDRSRDPVYYEKYKNLIDSPLPDFHKEIDETVIRKNKLADQFNKINLVLMIIGLIAISIYVILNL